MGQWGNAVHAVPVPSAQCLGPRAQGLVLTRDLVEVEVGRRQLEGAVKAEAGRAA